MANLEGIRPSLRGRVQWVIAEAKLRGANFWIESGYRSEAEQTRIFLERYSLEPIPGRPMSVWKRKRYWLKPGMALAAPPGKSLHGNKDANGNPDGIAVDVGCERKWNGLRIELFQRSGLCTPVPGEPWHAQERANAAQPIQTLTAKAVDAVESLPYFIIPNPIGPGFWELKKSDGGVGAMNGAPFFGSMPGVKAKVVAPLAGLTPCQRNGVVIGYWVTDIDGRLYAFGDAPYFTDYSSHKEWHSPNRKIAATVQTAGFSKGERIRYAQIGIEAGDADYVVDTYDIGLEFKE